MLFYISVKFWILDFRFWGVSVCVCVWGEGLGVLESNILSYFMFNCCKWKNPMVLRKNSVYCKVVILKFVDGSFYFDNVSVQMKYIKTQN